MKETKHKIRELMKRNYQPLDKIASCVCTLDIENGELNGVFLYPSKECKVSFSFTDIPKVLRICEETSYIGHTPILIFEKSGENEYIYYCTKPMAFVTVEVCLTFCDMFSFDFLKPTEETSEYLFIELQETKIKLEQLLNKQRWIHNLMVTCTCLVRLKIKIPRVLRMFIFDIVFS